MAFPNDPLGAKVELLVSGVWADITAYAFTRDPITVDRGRANESSKVEASSCSITLDNRDGRFSPRNPLSPYYGKIGRNTPVRVWGPSAVGALLMPEGGVSQNRVRTPDAAALDITGDIDICGHVRPFDWASGSGQFTTGKGIGQGAGTSAYGLAINAGGTLRMHWSEDGTAVLFADSTVTTGFDGGDDHWVRATLDVDNGASGRTIKFYTSDDGVDWTQLGADVVQAGTTSIHNSASALIVGARNDNGTIPLQGRIYVVQVRDGIDGTLVADCDFTELAAGTTSFTDSVGLDWTVESAAEVVTDFVVRFTGEVAVWPQAWNKPGTDVYTPVEAAGIMRRLGQGASPLKSALHRAIVDSDPAAYWVLDDGEGSTVAAPTVGDHSMSRSLGVTEYAQVQPASWLETLPKFTASGSLKGKVSMPGFTDEWGIGSIVLPNETDPDPFLAAYYDEAAGWMNIGLYMPSASIIRSFWTFHPDSGGTTGADFDWTIPADFLDGQPHWWELRLSQNGANIDHEVYVDGVALTLSAGTGVMSSRTLGPVHLAWVGRTGAGTDGDTLGHLAVWHDHAAMDGIADAAFGYRGETAGRRVERVCSEESVAFDSVGDLDDTAAMGPQPIDTFVELLQECAETDLGILYEPRDTLGLAYRTRTSIYNQATPVLELDYDAGVFGSLPEPIDDDQAVRNDVTVKRPDGSSARAILETGTLSTQAPPDGVGVYDTSVDANVVGDEFLQHQAAWRLALGTVDEARYPRLHLNLTAPAFTADAGLTAAAAGLDIGDRLTIDNPPSWLPPDLISQLAQGFTETLGNNEWHIEVNASPESPWQVAEYESAEGGTYRYDTAGSRIAEDFDAGTDTTMTVETTVLPKWTTDDDEFPFDIECGGVRLTVTDITAGAGELQTFTITQAPVNGIIKTIPEGTALSLWTKARYAL
jgi:hypothetical protein